MLQNAYFLAKIGADTAENEQHFTEILPKTGNYPAGPAGAGAACAAPSSRLEAESAASNEHFLRSVGHRVQGLQFRAFPQ